MMLIHKELPVLSFKTAAKFFAWLKINHAKKQGFWLRFYKKNSSIVSITPDEAVDTALCWGWIDGLINKYDEESYLLRFTPRRPKSVWSKINVAKIEKLTKLGLMQPAGLEQVEKAKADGRWDKAYEPASKIEVPADFIKMVKKDKGVYTFYQTLNRANIYAIAFRLTTVVNPEKRKQKMNQLFEMLKNKKAIYG
jgi:uncharacterized protein YdeI (YjbR/CyaY-like superfamily)